MALPPIPVSDTVDIPSGPGVPPLQRITRAANTAALLVADGLQILRSLGGPQWGIFDAKGLPFLIGDSVIAIGLRQDWRTANFPVEDGEFRSYNKVGQPFEIPLTFGVGGTEADRAAFMGKLRKAAGTTETFTVVMPEFSFARATITRFTMERRARAGVGLLQVDVWVEEIRVPQKRTDQKAAAADGRITAGQNPASASTSDVTEIKPRAPSSREAEVARQQAQ